MRGLESEQATIYKQVKTGARAALMNGNQALYAVETGYTIQAGDSFTGSFDWRTAANSQVDDVVKVTLFYTADDTLPNNAGNAIGKSSCSGSKASRRNPRFSNPLASRRRRSFQLRWAPMCNGAGSSVYVFLEPVRVHHMGRNDPPAPWLIPAGTWTGLSCI